MSAIFTRRSVRDFLPKAVESEKLDRILSAAFQAPSAHDRQPWAFLVITGQEDRDAIAAMSPYSKMCGKAAAVIACCADLEKGEQEDPEDSYWVQDLSAATENVLLQITEEGLGGVWLGWYPDKGRVSAFSARFKLPPTIVPVSLIALGYPAKETHPHSKTRFDTSRVHYESWEG
jgi:nitroreductase